MKYLMICVLCLFSTHTPAQNALSDLEAKLTRIQEPGDKLAFLQTLASDLDNSATNQQAIYWYWLGMTQDLNGLTDDAIGSFTQAITLFNTLKQKPSEEWVYSYIERSYMYYLRSNDIADYCPDRQQALELAERSDLPEVLVRSLIQVAFCYDDSREALVLGLTHLQRAIALSEQHNLAKDTKASVYNATANLYQQNYMLDKAYEYALKAYEAWRIQGEVRDSFDMLHSLAGLAPFLLKFDEARAHVQALFDMASKHPEFPDFAFFSELNAGLLAHQEKHHNKAIEHFQNAWAQRASTDETYFVREAERHLILNYFRAKQYDNAKAWLQEMRQRHPDFVEAQSDLAAINSVLNGRPLEAMHHIYTKLDGEVYRRNLFVAQSSENSTHIHNDRLTVMDNRLLQQELEIQRLQLVEEQSQARIIQLSLAIVIVVLVGLSVLLYFVQKSRKEFKRRANTDGLTGIANRRRIMELGEELAISPTLLSVLVFDVDHFKRVNDTLGHQSGDRALKRVVAQALRCLRTQDTLGRIGGEEFLLLLPDTDVAIAAQIAERIRSKVAHQHIRKGEQKMPLSVSIGVASQQSGEALEALIARADGALYQAKQSGRNRVVEA